MTSNLFSLLMVPTHALYLTSLLSNHLYHSKLLISSSDMLKLIISLSQRSSLNNEHAANFLLPAISPPITFSLLQSKLKLTFLKKYYPQLSTILCFCLSDWYHCITRFLFSSIFSDLAFFLMLVFGQVCKLSGLLFDVHSSFDLIWSKHTVSSKTCWRRI